jgi:antirestriction protein ArdC
MNSASDSEHPEQEAFRELAEHVRRLGHELETARHRAAIAERRLRDLGDGAGPGGRVSAERVAELERENRELRARLAAAGERTRAVLERVRFLRQQHELGVPR